MDLIYTDSVRADIGVLMDYEFDLAFGEDENNFTLLVAPNNHRCDKGSIVYIEGTEYGGIVDAIRIATATKDITYSGRTWHGILASKILEPDTGENYLVVSGEVNTIIKSLIERVGLGELFTVSEEDSGMNVTSYQMHRYIDCYAGIINMLNTVSGKLKISVNSVGNVHISAVLIVDYTLDEEFDSDQVEMEVEKKYNTVNHLVCLGRGELAERQVIHLYADADGNISDTQTFAGLQEYTAIYDYSNVESLEELKKEGIKKLKSLIVSESARIDFDADSKVYDIGDIVGANENITGIYTRADIVKKIVTIKKGKVNIEYKVGENK